MMIEKVMIQLKARGVAPMMIEKVMIQSGAKSLKNSEGVGPPPMMIEKLGAKNLKSRGGCPPP